ncbi:MAG: phosphatase [Bacteroidetes bacterium]|nr:MAG: phosphatase [Bacteroidota bacterium]
MNDTVIFDLDGVIIDSEPIHFQIEQQMFRELNIDISFSEHSSFVGTSSQNMWESIVNKHHLTWQPGELVKKNHQRYMDYLQGNRLGPIEGIEELIRALYEDNLQLLVASSSPKAVIEIVLQKFDFRNYFKALVSGTDLPHSKPHPDIFLKAAQLTGSAQGKCVVIEDSENGVAAARAAGMKCIGFLNPNSGQQDLGRAHIIIKSFKELDSKRIRNLE